MVHRIAITEDSRHGFFIASLAEQYNVSASGRVSWFCVFEHIIMMNADLDRQDVFFFRNMFQFHLSRVHLTCVNLDFKILSRFGGGNDQISTFSIVNK